MVRHSRKKLEILAGTTEERQTLCDAFKAEWKKSHGYGDENRLVPFTDAYYVMLEDIKSIGFDFTPNNAFVDMQNYLNNWEKTKTDAFLGHFPAYKAIERGVLTLQTLRERLLAAGEDLSTQDLQDCLRGGGTLPRQALDIARAMGITLDTASEHVVKISKDEPARLNNFFASPYWDAHPKDRWDCYKTILIGTDIRHSENAANGKLLLMQKEALKKEIASAPAPLSADAMTNIVWKAEYLAAAQLTLAYDRIDTRWSKRNILGYAALIGALCEGLLLHATGGAAGLNLLIGTYAGVSGVGFGGGFGVKHVLRKLATKYQQTEETILREAYQEAINALANDGKTKEAEQKTKEFAHVLEYFEKKKLQVDRSIDALADTTSPKKSVGSLLNEWQTLCAAEEAQQAAKIHDLNKKAFAQNLNPDAVAKEAALAAIVKEAVMLDLTKTELELHPVLQEIKVAQKEMGAPENRSAKLELECELCSGDYDLRNVSAEQLKLFTPSMRALRDAQITESGENVRRELEKRTSATNPIDTPHISQRS